MFSFLGSDLKVPIDISSPSVTLLARRKHAEYWGLSLTVLLLLDFTLVISTICTTASWISISTPRHEMLRCLLPPCLSAWFELVFSSSMWYYDYHKTPMWSVHRGTMKVEHNGFSLNMCVKELWALNTLPRIKKAGRRSRGERPKLKRTQTTLHYNRLREPFICKSNLPHEKGGKDRGPHGWQPLHLQDLIGQWISILFRKLRPQYT